MCTNQAAIVVSVWISFSHMTVYILTHYIITQYCIITLTSPLCIVNNMIMDIIGNSPACKVYIMFKSSCLDTHAYAYTHTHRHTYCYTLEHSTTHAYTHTYTHTHSNIHMNTPTSHTHTPAYLLQQYEVCVCHYNQVTPDTCHLSPCYYCNNTSC